VGTACGQAGFEAGVSVRKIRAGAAETHAYVIYHVPDDSAEAVKQVIDEARRVGRAHGVGVITMGDPRRWETWDELEEARRVEPDPERLDEFISVQLDRDAQDEIARAIH
jgi:hypothetical protein